MKRSRFNNKKKKKTKLIWGIIVAVVIVVIIFYIALKGDGQQEAQKDVEQTTQKNEGLEQEPVVNEQPEQQEPEKEKLPKPEVDESGYAVNNNVTEPTYIDGVLVANKKYPLPKDYNPGEDSTAVAALNKMKEAAKKEGYDIVAFSTFRSYEYQTTLYNNYVARDGQVKADRYSARPGYSEHQSGLAFDIGEQSRKDLWLTEEFGETPAGKWLASNAHKYGFILRYPKGKEDITGFMYESWHFRYLGEEVAQKVYDSGVTLEEYLGIE